MNTLVFDIETIPDVVAGRELLELEGLDDADTAKAMMHLQNQKTGTEFQRHHLHRIVAISVVLATPETLKVWSLGDENSDEQEILQSFYNGIAKYTPTLVSWNGGGFDLPVIHYRSLLYELDGSRYWETGLSDNSFRYNNYLSRYHERHTDLMDVLAAYQPRASAPLDAIASLCGFPGKMGMSGARVWDAWLAGEIGAIRDYCETDVLNTYLVYLRYQRLRGYLTPQQYQLETERLRQSLQQDGRGHLLEFSKAWKPKA